MRLVAVVLVFVLALVVGAAVPADARGVARSGREANANALERGARRLSDRLDRTSLFGKGSIARDVVHAGYHAGAGVVQAAKGVGHALHPKKSGGDAFANAGAEFKRAGTHLSNGGNKVFD